MAYHIYVAGGDHPLRPSYIAGYEHHKIIPIVPTPRERALLTPLERKYRPIQPIKTIDDTLVKARRYIIKLIDNMAPSDYQIYDDNFDVVGTLSYNRIDGLLWVTNAEGAKTKLYAFKIQKLHPSGEIVRGSARYIR